MTEIMTRLTPYLAPHYENFPKGRTISLVVLRTTQSETVFRTEGTGEPLTRETLIAGIKDNVVTQRLVMTKRKQIAPERRWGREFLRAHNLLTFDDTTCTLNSNSPCEKCIDCLLYGFAAGGGGAQKSRVWTEDAFSVLPARETWANRTINAIFETGTMRDENGKVSTALNTSEYIKPGVHFLGNVTLKDVTDDELRYVMGCILNTSRYGAISSRIGRMQNRILALYAGSGEIPSSLELIQHTHDSLVGNGAALEHPLDTETLLHSLQPILKDWQNQRGIAMSLQGQELEGLIADVDHHWSDTQREIYLKQMDGVLEQHARIAPTKTAKKSKKTKAEEA